VLFTRIAVLSQPINSPDQLTWLSYFTWFLKNWSLWLPARQLNLLFVYERAPEFHDDLDGV
jgi:hypothetical protein